MFRINTQDQTKYTRNKKLANKIRRNLSIYDCSLVQFRVLICYIITMK